MTFPRPIPARAVEIPTECAENAVTSPSASQNPRPVINRDPELRSKADLRANIQSWLTILENGGYRKREWETASEAKQRAEKMQRINTEMPALLEAFARKVFCESLEVREVVA